MTNHRIVWDTLPTGTPRTKMDILEERALFLKAELDKADAYLNGLFMTNCGLTCNGCGTLLETEADFAAHFIIPDARFLNLGGCPNG